jgi:competence protein ComFC
MTAANADSVMCGDCMRIPGEGWVPSRSSACCTEWVKSIIRLFKYRGKESLAIPPGMWMADVVVTHYRE